jgi:hypothetical protein
MHQPVNRKILSSPCTRSKRGPDPLLHQHLFHPSNPDNPSNPSSSPPRSLKALDLGRPHDPAPSAAAAWIALVRPGVRGISAAPGAPPHPSLHLQNRKILHQQLHLSRLVPEHENPIPVPRRIRNRRQQHHHVPRAIPPDRQCLRRKSPPLPGGSRLRAHMIATSAQPLRGRSIPDRMQIPLILLRKRNTTVLHHHRRTIGRRQPPSQLRFSRRHLLL